MNPHTSTSKKVKAWSVHLFTATGAIIGFKALEMAFTSRYYEAILLLFITLVIDGVDGTLARKFQVSKVLPRMDGHLIDYVIDFMNFVITPTVIFYQMKMVPEPMLFPCVALILYASLYHYGNTENVSSDYRFKGFPAFWNLVVYYLFILDMPPWANLITVIVFILLHFTSVPFVYVSRMQCNKLLGVISISVLTMVNIVILITYPDINSVWLVLAVIPLVVLVFLGVVNKELFPIKISNNSQE